MTRSTARAAAPRLSTNPRDFRSDINGLRAIAVSIVVLFHASLPLLTGGFAGVDVFFVISGFLMTQIIVKGLDAGRFSLPTFWLARATRIVPALLGLCLGLAAFGWVLIDPLTLATLASHAAASLLFYSNVQYWGEFGYFDTVAESKWLLHTWSLSVEWQFYLVYPVILAAIHRWLGPRAVRPLLWLGLLVSLALSVGLTAWRPVIAFYLLPPRAWEMIAGGLVLLHAGDLGRLGVRVRRGLEIAGLVLLGVSVLAFSTLTPWPSGWALVPVAGTALVIAAGMGEASLLRGAALQALGRWSYSIYLWHWPVIVAFRYFGLADQALAVPLEIAIALDLGFLSYAVIELPSQAVLRGRPPLRVAMALAACTVLALAWAGATMASGGFAGRAVRPDLMPDHAAARDDWDTAADSCTRAGPDRAIRICRTGPGGDAGTLVIGDSHAEQWLPRYLGRPGVDAVFVMRDGCPPMPDIRRLRGGANCPDFFAEAMRLAATGHDRTIVFTSFWHSYFRATSGADAICITIGDACRSPSRDPAAVQAAFDDFASALKPLAAHSRIVIVLPIAEPPADVPVELAKRDFFGLPTADVTEAPEAMVRARAGDIRRQLLRVAAATGATVVDPLGQMCDGTTCRFATPGGQSLFKDSNHLRASVVRDRFDMLDPYLKTPR